MSWRDRAVEVEESPKAQTGGWKSRAILSEPKDEERTLKQRAKNAIEDTVNIAKGVGSIAKGIGELPIDMVRTNAQMTMGGNIANTPLARKAAAVARGAYEGIKGTPRAIMDLGSSEAWFQTPVTNLLSAAGLVAPIAKGGAIAARAVKPAASSIGKRAFAKTANVAFGTPEEAVLARLDNPGAVKTAFPHAELADQMVTSVKNLGDTVGELADEAAKTLRASPYLEEGAIPKTKIASAIKASRRDLGGVFSKESQQAVGALKKVEEFYKKLKSTVSESQVKTLIQEIDADIDWSNPAVGRTNQALIGVRTRLDAMLKGQNPAYAEAMKPVSEATRTLEQMQKTFGIKRETGRGYVASDQTVAKLRDSLKENKLHTQSVLKRFQKVSGEDWENKLRNSNARSLFEGETTRGSRRAVAGAGIGELVGQSAGLPPAIGAALGTISGAFMDIYGRNIAGRITDVLASPGMGRYVSVMERAALKGPANVSAIHGLLMETDPKYRAALKGIVGKLQPATK